MSQLNPLRCSREELIKLVNTVATHNGWGEVLTSDILKELEKKGLPVEKTGSKKGIANRGSRYSIFELAVFLLMQYTATNENKIDKYRVEIIDSVMTEKNH